MSRVPPEGVFLASASNDRTVRVWDLRAVRRTVALLTGTSERTPWHTSLTATTSSPEGADGQVILWDVNRRAIVARALPNPARRRAADPAGDAINALAVSPDGRYVVIGRENGDLIRYNAANSARRAVFSPKANRQGRSRPWRSAPMASGSRRAS